jgi:hypothetical protein
VSVQHFIDPASGVVITTCFGRVTFQETLDSISTLRQNNLFRPTLPHLADLSGITKFEFTKQDIYDLHRIHDPFTKDHRAALVVTGVTRAAAIFFHALSGNPNLGLFSSLPDALSWLNLVAIVLPGYASHEAPSSHAIDPRRRFEIGLPERVDVSLRMPQSH